MPSKTVETVFRFVHDRAAAQALLRDQARIDDALDETTRTSARVEAAYSDMEQTASRVSTTQAEMLDSQIRLARESADIYGDVGSRLQRFGGLASSLGGPGAASRLMIASDILDATEAAKLMRAEMPKLTQNLGISTAALGVAGVAVGALAVGVTLFGKAAEKSRREVQLYLDLEAQRMENELALKGKTTEEIQNELRALQDAIDVRNEEIGRIQAEREERASNLNLLEQAGEAIGGPFNQGLDDLDKKIRALQEENAKAALTIIQFTQKLEQMNAVAGGLNIGGGLTDAVQQFVSHALVAGQQALPTLTAAYQENAGAALMALQGVVKFSDGLTAGLQTALTTGLEEANKLTEGAEQVAKYEHDRQEIIDSTEAAIAATEKRAADARAQAYDDYAYARTQREEDYLEQLDSLRAEHYDAVEKLRDDYNTESARAEKEYYRDRERAARAHTDTLLDAAANLDARGVFEEQKKYAREQKEADENFKDAKAERDRQYKAQLKDEQDSFRKRQQQAETAYRKQEDRQWQQFQRMQQQRDQAAANEIRQLQSTSQQKLLSLQAAHTAELAQLFGFQTQEYQIRQEHYDALRRQLEEFRNQQLVQGIGVVGTPGPVINVTGGNIRPTIYDEGGYGRGLGVVRPGEFVMAPQTTRLYERGMGGRLSQQTLQSISNRSSSVTIERLVLGDVGGYSPRQIRQLVREGFVEALQEARG